MTRHRSGVENSPRSSGHLHIKKHLFYFELQIRISGQRKRVRRSPRSYRDIHVKAHLSCWVRICFGSFIQSLNHTDNTKKEKCLYPSNTDIFCYLYLIIKSQMKNIRSFVIYISFSNHTWKIFALWINAFFAFRWLRICFVILSIY